MLKKLVILIVFIPHLLMAEWEYAAPLPSPREGLAVAELGGKIFAIGGKNQHSFWALNIVEVYDPATNVWSEGPSLNFPRIYSAAAVHNGRIFVFGGREGWFLVNEVEVFDPGVGEWEVLVDMQQRREGLTATTRGDSIYVISGQSDSMWNYYSNHTDVFNPLERDWDMNLSPLPDPRTGHAACLYGDSIFVMGGIYYGFMTDVSILSGNTWIAGTPLPSPLGNTGAAAVADSIFLVGGSNYDGVTSSVLKYSVPEAEWSDFSPMNETRENHGVIAVDGYLYAIGGGRGDFWYREYLASVEKYDLNVSVAVPNGGNKVIESFSIQNYPNPFSDYTNISITSVSQDYINQPVIVYDILGREIIRWEQPGWINRNLELKWNGYDGWGNPLPSGVYFIRLISDDNLQTKKISLIR